MYKRLLFLFLIFTVPAYSQNVNKQAADSSNNDYKEHRFSMGGSIGYSSPEVITTKYKIANTNSVYWYAPEAYINLNFQYQIFKHWGILAEIVESYNKIDEEKQDTDVPSLYAQYYTGQYFAGLFYSLAFKNGNLFEGRFLAGCTTFYEHEFSPSYNFFDAGPGAELGVTYKFHIAKKLYLSLDIAYMRTLPEFGYTYDFYCTLNAGAGIEYKF
ncbi:MAG: hypothetical protein ACLQQ4_05270 [Bacteroidia bacterium]